LEAELDADSKRGVLREDETPLNAYLMGARAAIVPQFPPTTNRLAGDGPPPVFGEILPDISDVYERTCQ
jgi:hypothetical protein